MERVQSRFGEQQTQLEMERRAREKREASAGVKRTSTLHRDSDFTLECPDGRVSPPPAPSRRPLSAASGSRSSGCLPGVGGRPCSTEVSVRYGPKKNGAPRSHAGASSNGGPRSHVGASSNGAPRSHGGNGGPKSPGGAESGREKEQPVMGEFERRLLNAKRLGKAPMPSVDKIPWYHQSISRHIAESLLMHPDICNGTYLLRNSSNSDESLTLSVRCRTALRHYRVHWDGRQFCFGLGKFPDVASLQDHFRQQPMISGDCGLLVKLSHPYPRGVVEPHDYQEANELSRYITAMEATVELTTPSLSVNSKEGFLTKLGYHRKNWKIRWFTLVRNELKYFNTKDDKTPLRTINLEEATAVERDNSMCKLNCFRLVLPYRTFYMIAQTEAEADDWIAILRWRIENNTTPTL